MDSMGISRGDYELISNCTKNLLNNFKFSNPTSKFWHKIYRDSFSIWLPLTDFTTTTLKPETSHAPPITPTPLQLPLNPPHKLTSTLVSFARDNLTTLFQLLVLSFAHHQQQQ
jgi:hypothetical protein